MAKIMIILAVKPVSELWVKGLVLKLVLIDDALDMGRT